MNAFTYILIVLVVGSLADVDSGNSERSNKLQQLISELERLNVPFSQNSFSGSNQSIYFTININFFNSSCSERPQIKEEQKIIKKLNDECVTDSECFSIPYAVCSSGNCSCSDNYLVTNGKCIGLLEESCEKDSDCGVLNSSCQRGYCKCKRDFYSTDNKMCLQYATVPNEICKSNEGCKNIPYSSCSNGRCLCFPNYSESSGKCLGSIDAMCNNSTDCVAPNAICNGICECPPNLYFEDNNCYEFAENYETPVASPKACKPLEDAVYVEGKCYKDKKLHIDSCDVVNPCTVSFSECFNGKCECKYEYAEHNNRCYAPEGGKCNTSEDCGAIWFYCVLGSCRRAHYFEDGRASSKPKATADWTNNKYDEDNWYIFPYFNASTSREVGDRGNLAWVTNYTLDRIVAGDFFRKFDVFCRAKNATGDFVPGKVKFYENNKLCQVDHEGQKFSTEDYEVYADLGYRGRA